MMGACIRTSTVQPGVGGPTGPVVGLTGVPVGGMVSGGSEFTSVGNGVGRCVSNEVGVKVG